MHIFLICSGSHFVLSVMIEERILDAGFSGPREDFRTGLAGAHVTNARLVPCIADLGSVTPFWPLLLHNRNLLKNENGPFSCM